MSTTATQTDYASYLEGFSLEAAIARLDDHRDGRFSAYEACCGRHLREGRGDIIKSYVVLREGHEPSEALVEEIRQRVRERLSTHAFPREIAFVETLPKTPSGKIQRFKLRAQAADEAAATVS